MTNFWSLFTSKDNTDQEQGHIYKKISTLLTNKSEEELVKIACIAGLCARISYVDFKLEESEELAMREVLKQWTQLSDQEVEAVVDLATGEIKTLGGVDNHLYVHQLKPFLSENERYQILISLFALAASDGQVENIESEDIRIIAKGFDLSDQHFLAARASVVEYIASLKA